jgi:hypothetical protein
MYICNINKNRDMNKINLKDLNVYTVKELKSIAGCFGCQFSGKGWTKSKIITQIGLRYSNDIRSNNRDIQINELLKNKNQ